MSYSWPNDTKFILRYLLRDVNILCRNSGFIIRLSADVFCLVFRNYCLNFQLSGDELPVTFSGSSICAIFNSTVFSHHIKSGIPVIKNWQGGRHSRGVDTECTTNETVSMPPHVAWCLPPSCRRLVLGSSDPALIKFRSLQRLRPFFLILHLSAFWFRHPRYGSVCPAGRFFTFFFFFAQNRVIQLPQI